MIMKKEIDILLFEYLDGKLEGLQLAQIKKRLEQDPELQARLDLFSKIHGSLGSHKLEEPSPKFTIGVMANLQRAQEFSAPVYRNGLILLSGIITALGIGIFFLDSGFFEYSTELLSLNEFKLPFPIKLDKIPTIPISGKWLVNAVIALNLGLAFLILDRAVLKPLFNKRTRIGY